MMNPPDLAGRVLVDQHALLDRNLTNHPPSSDEVVVTFEYIRAAAKDLGHRILESVPECRERSLAITHLEQAVMWAVAATARNQ